MTHSYSGRKRKTTAYKTRSKRTNVSTEAFKVPQHVLDRIEESRKFNERYPSYTGSSASTCSVSTDAEMKRNESKNWTVAPAYNKGAYQVIPKTGIKDIGR
jgi:hypothetical protein